MEGFFVKFIIIFILIFLFYKIFYDILGKNQVYSLIKYPITYFRLARLSSSNELNNSLRLILTGISQFFFCSILFLITQIGLGQLFSEKFHPILLIYGLLLGIGEMSLSSFLCHLGIRFTMALSPKESPSRMEDWLTLAKGGWMRQYLMTTRIWPMPIAFLSIILYISIEETIFRGILLNYFLSAGYTQALITSIFFFTIVQILHMPSWRSAMFPVIGALTVGFLHGLLFLNIPDIRPLIIAHLLYFISAIL